MSKFEASHKCAECGFEVEQFKASVTTGIKVVKCPFCNIKLEQLTKEKA